MRKKIRIMCLALILILNLTMVNAYASSTYDRDAIKSVQSILNMWDMIVVRLMEFKEKIRQKQ